jgi:hypothetical protein
VVVFCFLQYNIVLYFTRMLVLPQCLLLFLSYCIFLLSLCLFLLAMMRGHSVSARQGLYLACHGLMKWHSVTDAETSRIQWIMRAGII